VTWDWQRAAEPAIWFFEIDVSGIRRALTKERHDAGVIRARAAVPFETAAHCSALPARLLAPIATISGGKRHRIASVAVEVHRVVADRAGFRGVLPLVRGLCGDRDHVALGQMMTHPALDTDPARLAGGGYLRVDHLAAGDELRFAIHDDEHVVGVVVHLGAAL